MNEHRGLPEPFDDETGFPLPLTRIRGEVRARGGDITGEGLNWRIAHPDPDVPDIRLDITARGEVLIDAGDDRVMDVFCEEAWTRGSAEHPWTHLEDVLLGFLEGGFTRVVWRDADGAISHFAVSLKGSRIDESGGTAGTPDVPVATKTEVTYPAWPEPS